MGSISNDGTDETSYAVSIDRRLAAAAPDATGPFRDGGAASVANADYDGQVRSITSFSSAGAAGGIHTVREGDTLAGLAASLWGDASLWYKLASANGLSAASALVPGQTLTIPAGVTRSGRTAATFKPFDAGEVQGDLSPTTPKPQAAAARHNKCGAFGAIMLAAVAIAVVAVVGPAIIGLAANPLTGAAATGLTGVLGGAGAAAGSAAAIGAGVIGGGIAGAAGSIISQGVGVATGLQDKFSWKGVALAGIGGAVGGGLRGFDAFSKLGGATNFANDVARGALGSAISQGVGVATGLQSKFDFVGVAAAGVGAGIGGAVGRGIGFDPNLQGFHPGNIGLGAVANTASAIANAATRSALSGTNFGDNVMRALPDAIGNAIGQLAAAGAATAFDGIDSRALAKAAESPVEANKPTTGDRYADAIKMDATDRAIARAMANVAAANDPLTAGRSPQSAAAAYAAGEARGLAEYNTLSREYAGLSETDRLNFQSQHGVLLPVGSTAVADPNYLTTDQHRDASTMAELVVWEGTIRSLETQHGGSFSNSQDLRDAFAYNRTTLARSYAYAERQTWELTSSIIAPLAAPTAAFRMAVNGEITWGNAITVGASLFGLGALGKEVAAGARLASAGRAAESAGARTNFNVYEVLSEQPISGVTRGAHRNSANRALYRDLQSDPEFARMFDTELGTDVISHMSSGRNLLNPPGTVWHHPADNANVVQLLRSTEHTNPLTQPILHPRGIGGFGTHYGN